MNEQVQGGVRLKRARGLLDTVTSLAVVLCAVVFLFGRSRAVGPAPLPQPPPPTEPISLAGAASLGDQSAPVGLLEFADFECRYCAKFALEVLPTLQERYINGGRLRLIFRHLPIRGHRYAEPAALAASCAAEQGQFKPIHDLLFANFNALNDDSLEKYVKQVGLDRGSYETCLVATGPAQVKDDAALAKSLGFNATPSFLIGRVAADGRLIAQKMIKGVKPIQEFVSAIDEALASR